MKWAKFIFIVAFFTFKLHAAAETFSGSIDFASNSVTTTYELVGTVSSKIRRLACQNTSDTALWLSLVGAATNCSDAANNWILGATGQGSFAFDGYPRPNKICVKTLTGTVTSGVINCHGWWDSIR